MGVNSSEALRLVNNARAQSRLCGSKSYAATTSVTWNGQLESASQVHSLDMANTTAKNNANPVYFSHTGSNGSDVGTRISNAGYAWNTYGENIAYDYNYGYPNPESVAQTLAQVIQGWIDSPGHCANIMNPNFKDIAIVRVTITVGRSYYSFWTFDLGRSR